MIPSLNLLRNKLLELRGDDNEQGKLWLAYTLFKWWFLHLAIPNEHLAQSIEDERLNDEREAILYEEQQQAKNKLQRAREKIKYLKSKLLHHQYTKILIKNIFL